MLAGPIKLFGKSGPGVIISGTDDLIKSASNSVATTFQLVVCRAVDTVPQNLRHLCYSLMDSSRPGWYARHGSFYLRIDEEAVSGNIPLFKQDCSFFLHTDMFYPGYYAFESLNLPNHYIWFRNDGVLKIEPLVNNAAYHDSASWSISVIPWM